MFETGRNSSSEAGNYSGVARQFYVLELETLALEIIISLAIIEAAAALSISRKPDSNFGGIPRQADRQKGYWPQ